MLGIFKRCAIVAIAAMFLCAGILCENGICQDKEVKVLKKGDETTAKYIKNSVCPVSEDDIVTGEAVMVEYDGKIYNLCCDACVKHFKKFPEKFAKKATLGMN